MQKNQKGFTLIELLVVVGILGILAAIAIPIYSDYRNSAFRAAAKAALTEGAQNMERFFTRNNTYVGAVVGDPADGDQVLGQTEGAKYVLAFPVALTQTTFTIRATPNYNDTCGNLSINQAGLKLPANCW